LGFSYFFLDNFHGHSEEELAQKKRRRKIFAGERGVWIGEIMSAAIEDFHPLIFNFFQEIKG